jgi:hypothetical protein
MLTSGVGLRMKHVVQRRIWLSKLKKKPNFVALVRDRTVPIELPPLVGEVSGNFRIEELQVVSVTDPLWPYSSLSRPEPLLFLSSSSSVVLTRLSGPRSRLTTSQKIWWRREWNPVLWICSQELLPLDHRGGENLAISFVICSVAEVTMEDRDQVGLKPEMSNCMNLEERETFSLTGDLN